VILEPEGLNTDELYCNGISTSLPPEVQERVVRSIPALENARITQHGYAVEYDYVPPSQTQNTLESRAVRGLFFAGQINGTSGYEEAAGQGLVAGANAFSRARGLPPFTLRRDQAYIGVMIDDLITRGGDEPYRMFTSRSEHRLLLRQDNADRRLGDVAFTHGLLSIERKTRLDAKVTAIAALRAWCESTWFPGVGRTVAQRLKAPESTTATIRDDARAAALGIPDAADETWEAVEIDIKYAGYLARLDEDIARSARHESWVIPPDFDYASIKSLRNESREKLSAHRPPTLGVAGRLPGVTPADVSLLAVHLRAFQPASEA
jgi:tRNA uridine 5-carboxymethylaminomethyl modification enzyme